MPVHSFDQSTGARARRRRQHDALLREQIQESQYRRQTRPGLIDGEYTRMFPNVRIVHRGFSLASWNSNGRVR